jgi:hypothetical protein
MCFLFAGSCRLAWDSAAIKAFYSMCSKLSLDVSPKTLEAFHCRAFLWKGRNDANGGHCLVVWDRATTPKCYGGLSIPNLHLLNLALRCRWAWLRWIDPTRPWTEFDMKIPHLSMALFEAATDVVVGNREWARFWHDRWLDGAWLADVTPHLVAKVPPRKASS